MAYQYWVFYIMLHQELFDIVRHDRVGVQRVVRRIPMISQVLQNSQTTKTISLL